jgi:hypothetical protein
LVWGRERGRERSGEADGEAVWKMRAGHRRRRTSLAVPPALTAVVAAAVFLFADDCPFGSLLDLQASLNAHA